MKQTPVLALAVFALALIGLVGAVTVEDPINMSALTASTTSYELLSGNALKLAIPAFAAGWGNATAGAYVNDTGLFTKGLPLAVTTVSSDVSTKNTHIDPTSCIDLTVASISGIVNSTGTLDTHTLTLNNLSEAQLYGLSLASGVGKTDVSAIRTAWSAAQFETSTNYNVGTNELANTITATSATSGGAAAIADACNSFKDITA